MRLLVDRRHLIDLNQFLLIFLAFLSVILTNAASAPAYTYQQDWLQSIGTSEYDSGSGIEVSSNGRIYFTGLTRGAFGVSNAGSLDAFVAEIDDDGNQVWLNQFGGTDDDLPGGLATLGDHVFLTGVTGNSSANRNGADVFLSKYSADGGLIWSRTIGSDKRESTGDVATDQFGNVYVAGMTEGVIGATSFGSRDAFINKYDTDGRLLWSHQLGTPSQDWFREVIASQHGVVIVGDSGGDWTIPNAGSQDVVVTKYSPDGQHEWSTQFGTEEIDNPFAVTMDQTGAVYVAGNTSGKLADVFAGGRTDWFLSKISPSGDREWTRQFGTDGDDGARDIAIDSIGNLLVLHADEDQTGNYPTILSTFSPTGDRLNRQLLFANDMPFYETANRISVAPTGELFVSGDRANDAFVAKFVPVPESTSAIVLSMGALCLIFVVRSRDFASLPS